MAKSATRYGNGVIFNNRPEIIGSYEATEKYYRSSNSQFDKNNNYILSNQDIVVIARNQKNGLLTEYSKVNVLNINQMSDYDIATNKAIRTGINVILSNAHRRYTYTSPVYSDEISKTISNYQAGKLTREEAQAKIIQLEQRNQLEYINLLKNGPAVWAGSSSINMAIDKLNYERMVTNYNNGVYANRGLSTFEAPNVLDTSRYVRENIKVPDIGRYLSWLKGQMAK